MNDRQRRFAEQYSVDHNGAAAEVARLDAKLAGRLGLTQESMIGELLFYHEEAKAGRMPAMAGIRALEAVAKMSGFMVERSEAVSTEVKVWTLTFDRELEPFEE